MYLSYERIVATATVKTVSDLSVPADAALALCELQADTQPIHYTMDDSTDPTVAIGMRLDVGAPPKLFTIEDLKRIRFVRAAANDGYLNIHYVVGRVI